MRVDAVNEPKLSISPRIYVCTEELRSNGQRVPLEGDIVRALQGDFVQSSAHIA